MVGVKGKSGKCIHTAKHNLNISKGHKGITHSEEHKKKISETLKNNGIGFKKGCIPFNKGMFGEESHNWKGNKGRTRFVLKLRNCFKYLKWRSNIFERDDYVCMLCNKRGGILNADHIKPFAKIIKENNIVTFEDGMKCRELWNINNGRTLCKPCHEKTETYGGNKKII